MKPQKSLLYREVEQALFMKVELTGFEPVTPTLPVWCATSCAIAPLGNSIVQIILKRSEWS